MKKKKKEKVVLSNSFCPKKGSRWLWRHWCSIHHRCATSWVTSKKVFVKNRQNLTDWVIRQAKNELILYLCNIYIVLIYAYNISTMTYGLFTISQRNCKKQNLRIFSWINAINWNNFFNPFLNHIMQKFYIFRMYWIFILLNLNNKEFK